MTGHRSSDNLKWWQLKDRIRAARQRRHQANVSYYRYVVDLRRKPGHIEPRDTDNQVIERRSLNEGHQELEPMATEILNELDRPWESPPPPPWIGPNGEYVGRELE